MGHMVYVFTYFCRRCSSSKQKWVDYHGLFGKPSAPHEKCSTCGKPMVVASSGKHYEGSPLNPFN